MIIAVNTRVLPDDYPSVYRYFIYEIFKRIAGNNPEHDFIFIADRKSDQSFVTGSNVKKIVTGPAANYRLLMKFWFDIKVPALLRKYKADVFVSCDSICSLATKVPQCIVLHDLAFLQKTSFMSKNQANFLKTNISKFLNKANTITVTSLSAKQAIANNYNIAVSSIDVVFNAVAESFRPISDEGKLITKNNCTEGKEFFLYVGDIHAANNLLNLLKAFSVFKKRQQTGMKLVLVGKVSKKYQSFRENLKSYKYRKDIVVIENTTENELINIIGSAYGLINPSMYDGFVPSVLQAMRCNVPVITTIGSSMQEITEGATLYVDGNSHRAIADKMMLIYKDENLGKKLGEKGKFIADKFNLDKTADLLWQSILKAYK